MSDQPQTPVQQTPTPGVAPERRVFKHIPFREQLPQPSIEYRSAVGKWLSRGEPVGHQAEQEVVTHPWWKVIWLTGVDYFSTLGYQPGIALIAAGAVAPIATVILVLVTLLGALPVYAQVAGRSFAGQGSIAMLENLLAGWKGKVLVLVLLGFAATDFVITMTLSAADAAKHAIENPLLHPVLGERQILLTLVILTVLCAVFLKGFREAIGLATTAAVPYLALNLVVLGRGLWEVITHPALLANWRAGLAARGDASLLIAGAVLVFPKLALGLSGFETGVTVMPLIDGGEADRGCNPRKGGPPLGRIANTRKLLLTAAAIMSIMLMLSSFATTLLISPLDYKHGGKASGRAIAFLAHRYFGAGFGTLYDVSTIVILGLAGASAMAGLLQLIPRYLPRFGMAPRWAELSRPLVLTLFVIDVVITLIFRADVEAQSGAYATGVLVLILSAAFAATRALWRERRWGLAFYTGIFILVFGYTLAENCLGRPDGLIIGTVFTLLLMLACAISRSIRSVELRVPRGYFADVESWHIGPELRGKKVHLVPVDSSSVESRRKKKAEIVRHYNVQGPFLFLHVNLLDNRSEFSAPLEVSLQREGEDYVGEIFGAVAVANSIAFVSEAIDPISIFLKRFFEWLEFLPTDRPPRKGTRKYYHVGWKLLEKTTMAGRRVDHVERDDISALAVGSSPANTNNALRTLRRMLKQAQEWGLVHTAPKIRLVEEPGREIMLEPWMEANLLAVMEVERTPSSKHSPQSANYGWQPLRDVLLIMLDTGMRPAEVFRMEWEHVKWDRDLIFVPRSKSRKSKRDVPLSERVKAALLVRTKDSSFVFPSARSCSGHIETVQKQFVRAKKLASLPDAVVLYCARHRFSTDAMDGTGNLMAVMDVMGHSRPDVTRLYQHPGLKQIGMAINKRNEVVQ